MSNKDLGSLDFVYFIEGQIGDQISKGTHPTFLVQFKGRSQFKVDSTPVLKLDVPLSTCTKCKHHVTLPSCFS